MFELKVVDDMGTEQFAGTYPDPDTAETALLEFAMTDSADEADFVVFANDLNTHTERHFELNLVDRGEVMAHVSMTASIINWDND